MTKTPKTKNATAKKKWSELGRGRQIAVTAAGVAQIALAAVAAADLARRPKEEVRGPKALWSLALMVNWVGPISYFVVGRTKPTDLPLVK